MDLDPGIRRDERDGLSQRHETWLPDVKKPAAGDTSQRAFSLSVERTFPPRNVFVRWLRFRAAPFE